MSSLLLRTPTPNATESLLGYVLRVSEVNGYDSPWDIMVLTGLSQDEMRSAGFPHAKLATVVGHDTELPRQAYHGFLSDGRREFRILGHSLGRSLQAAPLRLAEPALCPQCINEDGFIDAFWDLSLALACPRHGCRVTDSCPKCSKPLRWMRRGCLTCACGGDLGKAPVVLAPIAVKDLMQVLQAKLHGHSLTTSHCSSGMPLEHLETLSLHALLFVISTLARQLEKKATDDADLKSHMEGAAYALADWPRGFYTYMHRLGQQTNAHEIGFVGLRAQFSSFYDAFFQHPIHSKQLGFMREAFINFGRNSWGEALVDNRLSDQNRGSSRFASPAELSRQLGVSVDTVRRWISNGKLSGKAIQTQSKIRYIADLNDVVIPQQTTGRKLRSREAAAAIGLPVKILKALREEGIFKVLSMPEHANGYHEADLEVFRQRLIRKCELSNEKPDNGVGLISLDHVMQNIKFHDTAGRAGFITAYLGGEIAAIRRTGDHIGSIHFHEEDVAHFAKVSRRKGHEGQMTKDDTAARLQCSRQALAGLLAAGHLHYALDTHRNLLNQASVEAFAQQYVSLRELARTLNTSARRLHQLCLRFSLPILAIAKQVSGCVPFLPREQIDELHQKHLDFPARRQDTTSTHEKSDETEAALQTYFEWLSANNLPLPRRRGRPFITKIATAAGIHRNTFYCKPAIQQMLANFEQLDRINHGDATSLSPH